MAPTAGIAVAVASPAHHRHRRRMCTAAMPAHAASQCDAQPARACVLVGCPLGRSHTPLLWQPFWRGASRREPDIVPFVHAHEHCADGRPDPARSACTSRGGCPLRTPLHGHPSLSLTLLARARRARSLSCHSRASFMHADGTLSATRDNNRQYAAPPAVAAFAAAGRGGCARHDRWRGSWPNLRARGGLPCHEAGAG